MEAITLYNKDGKAAVVEKGSQGEAEMRALGFAEKPKPKLPRGKKGGK